MDYATALQHVMGLTDLERIPVPATERPRYDLGRMRALLQRLGEPHTQVPAIHVTGTKGKGSTCTMIASILAQSGYDVGLYTSPHLHTVRERIRLGQTPLSEADFTARVERVWPMVEELKQGEAYGRVTTFELLTAMAFSHFAETRQDLQVVEVGLGGTLDATNVVEDPGVCVLTSISLDHTDILGNKLEEIARDKSGIIKSGALVVVAPQRPQAMEVIEEVCQERCVPLVKVGEVYQWQQGPWDLEGQHFQVRGPSGQYKLWMPLLGEHQLENACCALAVVAALGEQGIEVSAANLASGLRNVQWPGRLEVLRQAPLLVVDGAHNPYSMRRLVEAVQYYFSPRRCILIVGFSRGHDLEHLVAEAAALKPVLVLATRSRHPRAASSEEIMQAFQLRGVRVQMVDGVGIAVERALEHAGAQDLILGTGSLFTVAEVREHVLGIPAELYPEVQTSIPSPRST